MKALVRLVVCSALFLFCSTLAIADTVQVNGTVSFDQNTLTFAPPFSNGTDSGIFQPYANSTVNYVLGNVPAYNDGVPATEQIFNLNNGTDTLAFFDESNTVTKSIDANGNLSVLLHESGYYSIDNGAELAGYFDVAFTGTTPDGSAGAFVNFFGNGGLDVPTIDPAAGVAPEPTSILFLGTGLLSLAVLLRTRQRQAARPVR